MYDLQSLNSIYPNRSQAIRMDSYKTETLSSAGYDCKIGTTEDIDVEIEVFEPDVI